MNAGYIACLVGICAAILLLTGWGRQLAGDFSPVSAFVFLTGLTVLTAVSGAGGAAAIYPLLWTAAWGAAAWSAVKPASRRVYVLFSAMLGCAVWLWARELYAVDPVFVLWDAQLDAPLLVGALCALMTAGVREQFVVAAVSSLAGAWPVTGEAAVWAWADSLALTWLTVRFVSWLSAALLRSVPLCRRPFAGRLETSRLKGERER
ncbi:hypothetical protein [uncultured Paenibacillus sp.]|uniref:hypothetical protein n=1 Tax=uncultured Paenibacillus sp. TaxID=227322 RepID=UPI0028D540EE|nr:hypothetical protein [uncultured Paenibacillus sp.]